MDDYEKVLQLVATRLDTAGIHSMLSGSTALGFYGRTWAKDSHSEFQLTDVRSLFESLPDLDRAYLHSWASVLGVEALLREVMPT